MDITVIIVNYNVKYFLEQCLFSLQAALKNVQSEIIVVDNNSTDGSVQFLQTKFPRVFFIQSQFNLGFSKANNLALKNAKGKYVLFLNPDTIVSEQSIEKSMRFLENMPSSGATGIRMIDGSGKYLKESKRGYPTLWVSFCKMAGLTNLFPDSSLFAGYYLGHRSTEENQKVDALSGAYMLVKKAVLDKTGGFDERFFMYAEDIDLSYRIGRAGFSNHYFSEETIIHFKGESTVKDAAYTRQFYKAMLQFVQKHEKGPWGTAKIFLLNAAIRIKTGFVLLQGNREAVRSETPPQEFTFQGDHQAGEQMRQRLTENNHAEAVIFCIGKEYTYTQAIADLEKSTYKNNYFYSVSSSAAVGSSSKDQRGEVIALRKD